MAKQSDYNFLAFLQHELGNDYADIIVAFLKRYRFISKDPPIVRLKSNVREPSEIAGIYLDVNNYRYFYLKAAIITPADYTGGAIKTETLRYQSQVLMLSHFKSLSKAIKHDYFSLWTIYPAELRKMARRYYKFMEWIEFKPYNKALGGRMNLTSNPGLLDELETAQEKIIDIYEFSEDDLPRITKALPTEAPVRTFPIETKSTEKEEEPVDFSYIKDASL